jgi:hypothetical protein
VSGLFAAARGAPAGEMLAGWAVADRAALVRRVSGLAAGRPFVLVGRAGWRLVVRAGGPSRG